MYEDPKRRLITAEAKLLETLSSLVWIVAIFIAAEMLLSFWDKEFVSGNRGSYNIIIVALISLVVILKVLGLVDKHLMEYWKRKDVRHP